MGTQIVTIDPAHPEPVFLRCRKVINSGGLIVYPTDTFYALGADPRNPAAVRKLFSVKGRQADQPILLLLKDAVDARTWAAEISPRADDLMKRFWPGPLTLVFTANADVLPELTAYTGTIGLRAPGAALTRGLLRFLDMALTGTSANLSGGPSPRTAEEAATAIGDRVDLVLDGGPTAGGQPSTIVDMSSAGLRIIREGAIPLRDILGRS